MKRVVAFVLGLGLASPAVAAPQPVDLQPSGPWKVEYGESSCLLNRPYSAEGKSYRLELTFEPVQSDVWLRIYDPTRSRSRDDGEAVVEVDGAQVGDNVHFNVIPKDGGTTREFWLREFSKVQPMKNSLRLLPRRHSELRLTTTDFPKAMQAVAGCVDDLHRSLGVDPNLLKTIATKPQGWAAKFMELPDYQDEFHFQILFWVAASGRVDECHLLAPTGKPKFDKTACEQLMKNGRFVPATNAAGKPVRAPVYENAHIIRRTFRS